MEPVEATAGGHASRVAARLSTSTTRVPGEELFGHHPRDGWDVADGKKRMDACEPGHREAVRITVRIGVLLRVGVGDLRVGEHDPSRSAVRLPTRDDVAGPPARQPGADEDDRVTVRHGEQAPSRIVGCARAEAT